jgi:hypothetical protein
MNQICLAHNMDPIKYLKEGKVEKRQQKRGRKKR